MERRLTVIFVVAAAMLLMAGSAQALLSEDFTGTTGDSISTLGWTITNDDILISDTLVDVGQSGGQATVGGGETWSTAIKDLSAPVTLVGAQLIVVDYVLRTPDSLNEENNTWVTLRTHQNNGDPNGRFRVGNGLQFVGDANSYIARTRIDRTTVRFATIRFASVRFATLWFAVHESSSSNWPATRDRATDVGRPSADYHGAGLNTNDHGAEHGASGREPRRPVVRGTQKRRSLISKGCVR